MYKNKTKTSKIDFKVNADLAKLECKKQRLRYQNINESKVKDLVDYINTAFINKNNGICPICGGVLRKHRTNSNGFYKYRCIDCHKTYWTHADTIFFYTKLKIWQLWSIVDNMAINSPIRLTAFTSGFSPLTSYKRRKQIMTMFPDVSKEKVWGHEVIVDETYYESREHNLSTRFDNNHKRIKKRGLSADKACVYTAITGHANHLAINVFGDGKPSEPKTEEALTSIVDIDRTKLIQSDGEKTYETFCRKHNIECKSEKKNPAMVWINAVHSKMKNFTNQFWGIKKSQLQLYMNWFAYTYKWTYVGLAEKMKLLHELFMKHFVTAQHFC